jgi:hypothetical protein
MKTINKIFVGIIVASALVIQGRLSNVQSAHSRNDSSNEAIRPFHVNIPENKLVDLKRRILATQWPERETVNDATQGIQLITIKELAD